MHNIQDAQQYSGNWHTNDSQVPAAPEQEQSTVEKRRQPHAEHRIRCSTRHRAEHSNNPGYLYQSQKSSFAQLHTVHISGHQKQSTPHKKPHIRQVHPKLTSPDKTLHAPPLLSLQEVMHAAPPCLVCTRNDPCNVPGCSCAVSPCPVSAQ